MTRQQFTSHADRRPDHPHRIHLKGINGTELFNPPPPPPPPHHHHHLILPPPHAREITTKTATRRQCVASHADRRLHRLHRAFHRDIDAMQLPSYCCRRRHRRRHRRLAAVAKRQSSRVNRPHHPLHTSHKEAVAMELLPGHHHRHRHRHRQCPIPPPQPKPTKRERTYGSQSSTTTSPHAASKSSGPTTKRNPRGSTLRISRPRSTPCTRS